MMKCVIRKLLRSLLYEPLVHVVFEAQRRHDDATYFLADAREAQWLVEKYIRLIAGQDLLDLRVNLLAFRLVKLLRALREQALHLLVDVVAGIEIGDELLRPDVRGPVGVDARAPDAKLQIPVERL